MGTKQVHRGALEAVAASTLISDIFRGRFTGLLSMEREDQKNLLYIRNGQVIFAESSELEDRLGQVLIRGERITEDQIEQALATKEKNGVDGKQLLGTILVQEGVIEPLDLVWAVRTQVEGIFRECFCWSEGSFAFAEESDPDSWDVISLEFAMPDLMQSAIALVEDPVKLAGLLGDFSQSVTVDDNWMGLVERFKLQSLEFDLLGRVQAGADTLATLVLSAPYPAIETGRSILLLKCLGVITLNPA